jgi:hypothetical protein
VNAKCLKETGHVLVVGQLSHSFHFSQIQLEREVWSVETVINKERLTSLEMTHLDRCIKEIGNVQDVVQLSQSYHFSQIQLELISLNAGTALGNKTFTNKKPQPYGWGFLEFT